jgi:hypothetical protein
MSAESDESVAPGIGFLSRTALPSNNRIDPANAVHDWSFVKIARRTALDGCVVLRRRRSRSHFTGPAQTRRLRTLPDLLLLARGPRRAGVRFRTRSRAGRASGRAATPCPPDSRARARALRRRCSCSSPRPALASRRPAHVRWLRAPRLRKRRWHGKGALCHGQASRPTKATPPVKRRFESSRAHWLLPLAAARAHAPNACSRPGARAAGRSRLVRYAPAHVQGASPALPALFAATRARVSTARRSAVAARAGGVSKEALARNRLDAQAPLPTKAAPPVKRRFGSSRARRLLPLSAARAYAPNAQSRPGARAARRSRRVRQTSGRVQGGLGPPLVLFAAARARVLTGRRRGAEAGVTSR